MEARNFIKECLTIDPMKRITAERAINHAFVAEPRPPQGSDLLPVIKKNFNARRTLHAAIDTIRAINKLREGGAAGMMDGALSNDPPRQDPRDQRTVAEGGDKMEVDSRGNGRGQTAAQMREQSKKIQETSKGLWGGTQVK